MTPIKFVEDNFLFTEDIELRPSDEELRQLEDEFSQIKCFKHKPGDGLHHIPRSPIACFRRSRWSLVAATSEEAVLAHTEDVCKELGLDFEALCQKAYPKSKIYPVTKEDRDACDRPATKDDREAVLADLDAVHYYSLKDVLDNAIRGLEF